jgi:hypothetical protein
MLLLKFQFRVEFFHFSSRHHFVSGVDFPQLLSYGSHVLGSHYGAHVNAVLKMETVSVRGSCSPVLRIVTGTTARYYPELL